MGLNILNKNLFADITKEKKDKIIDFFKAAGSKEISEKEEIDFILNTFYRQKGKSPSLEQHKKHIKRFIFFYKKNKLYRGFDSSYFLLGSDRRFRIPSNYYIDKPFTETALLNIEKFLHKKPLWEGYTKIDGFEKFAKDCGVIHKLPVIKTSIPIDHPEKEILHEDYWQRHK